MTTSELRAHYDGYYDDAPSRWRELGARDKAANIADLWDANNRSAPSSVLEVGCGEGAVLAELTARGWPARGIEISGSGARVAQDRGLDVETYDGDHIPAADDSYELAVLSHVVEHLENPRLVLDEVRRVARWVVVEVPLEYRWRTPRDFQWTDLGHINLYDPLLIRQLLQSTGLEVVAESVTNPSRDVHVFQRGMLRGSALWGVREVAVRAWQSMATKVFVYHDTLLCRATG